MFTRDNAIWTLGLLAGVLGFVAGHFNRFPFISVDYQSTIELTAGVLALVSSKFGMSPLPVSPAGVERLTAQVAERTEAQSADVGIAKAEAVKAVGTPPAFDVWKLLGR